MHAEALLLMGAVAAVGVLHTIVPDHWVPITLIARQRGWSNAETALASFQAGIGHVLSTLAIGLIVWIAGVAFATRFGNIIDAVTSLALVAFGGWIAISGLREIRRGGHGHRHGRGHGHTHDHDFSHLDRHDHWVLADGVHGPELQRIETHHGVLELSIFEDGVPPRFRLTGVDADFVRVETVRGNGRYQTFVMAARGAYWESLDEIPEPHSFAVTVLTDHKGHVHTYTAEFTEHNHTHGAHDHHSHDHDNDPASDSLYLPLQGGSAVLVRHAHAHRHGNGRPHVHLHDHDEATAHEIIPETDIEPLLHVHKHKTSSRTGLLIILGSSPMVEGIPAFFAAGKYGIGVIILMAVVFAFSTIATYVLLCVCSAAGLQRVNFGAAERYGEVLSGGFIALVGVAFYLWPVL